MFWYLWLDWLRSNDELKDFALLDLSRRAPFSVTDKIWTQKISKKNLRNSNATTYFMPNSSGKWGKIPQLYKIALNVTTNTWSMLLSAYICVSFFLPIDLHEPKTDHFTFFFRILLSPFAVKCSHFHFVCEWFSPRQMCIVGIRALKKPHITAE